LHNYSAEPERNFRRSLTILRQSRNLLTPAVFLLDGVAATCDRKLALVNRHVAS
jgi:hypothetical protein